MALSTVKGVRSTLGEIVEIGVVLYGMCGPVPKYQHSAATRAPAVFRFPGDWRRKFSGLGWLEGGRGIHHFGFRAFFLLSFFVVACLLDYGWVAPGLRYSDILSQVELCLNRGRRKKERKFLKGLEAGWEERTEATRLLLPLGRGGKNKKTSGLPTLFFCC